jgi:hypothetical protein
MKERVLLARVEYIKRKLSNANSRDPRLELDEEAVENYQLELEKLERALDKMEEVRADRF